MLQQTRGESFCYLILIFIKVGFVWLKFKWWVMLNYLGGSGICHKQFSVLYIYIYTILTVTFWKK